MTKLIQIRDFAKSGLNSDLLPWDLQPSFLTEVRNIRIANSRLNSSSGHYYWSTMPDGIDPGFIGFVSGFWILCSVDSIYAFNGSSYADISSDLGYPGVADSTDWTGCLLSRIPIANNPSWYPEYWPQLSLGITMEPLPWDATQTWDDANQSCKIMRSHKQFLFALNLVDNGVDIKDGVRWSSPADIGGIPETWDPLDITNVAGITNLGGGSGDIVDGLTLRDAFVVYRESGISVFDYVGGQYVWRIRHLDSTAGLLNKNCIAEVNGIHYFIGDGDVFKTDGNTVTSLMNHRVKNRFLSSIDSQTFDSSYVIKNKATSELWFCIPEVGHTYPNAAYIYNWLDDTWSIRDIPEAKFAAYGAQGSAIVTWDSMVNTWDTIDAPWDRNQRTPFDDNIIAPYNGDLVTIDYSNGQVLEGYGSIVERIGLPLEGLDTVTTITRAYPHIKSRGDVFVQIGSQDYPGAPTRWKAPVLFNSEYQRKVDVRTTGELHCFRIYSSVENGDFEISGIDVEYVLAGTR